MQSRRKQKSVTTGSIICSLNKSTRTNQSSSVTSRSKSQQYSFLSSCFVFLSLLEQANAFVYFKGKKALYMLAAGIGNQEIEPGSIYYPKVYNRIGEAISKGICGVEMIEGRLPASSGTTIIREPGAAIFKYGSSTARTTLDTCLNDFVVKTVQAVEKEAGYPSKSNNNTAVYIAIAIAFLVMALTAILIRYQLAARVAAKAPEQASNPNLPLTPPRRARRSA